MGLACHIGSQISDLSPLRAAFATHAGPGGAAARPVALPCTRLDIGGGLAAPYFNHPEPPSPDDLADMVAEVLGGLAVELSLEPGRSIAANAGVLLSRVIHVHARPDGPSFLVLDAAMNDLVRPAMYDAYHDIRPVHLAARRRAAGALRRGRAHLRDRRHLRPRPAAPAAGTPATWWPS